MSKSHSKKAIVPVLWFLTVVFCLLTPFRSFAAQADIQKIAIRQNPLSIDLHLTGQVPVKVIKVEKRQLLIALKNATLSKGFKIDGKKESAFKDIAVEKLSGNVIAVVLNSHQPFGPITSGFEASNTVFKVGLESKKAAPATQPDTPLTPKTPPTGPPPPPGDQKQEPVKRSPQPPAKVPERIVDNTAPDPIKISDIPKLTGADERKKEEKTAEPAREVIPMPLTYVPPEREKSKYKGDINDILYKMSETGCNEDTSQVGNALSLMKNRMYAQAFEVLDQYIRQENVTCLEDALFLKAHVFFRTVKEEEFNRLIQAERMFQDALISYPESEYIPYGYAGIGLIQKQLNNISAAEGYFNIIKQEYPEYSGLSEVMYHLADIYDLKGYPDKAMTYYKQVFEDTRENAYIADAGVGYGKTLFNKRQYLNALTVLNYVVESFPKKVYESSDLLLFIGNANYEVGLSRQARDSLNRVMNLFPALSDRDIVLTRIGDTYGMDNDEERATKIYELVREKFPDTEGYIASSIGIARYLKNDDEKMEIYQMIKTKFPENTFARIAMMRIAEIYQKQGEYDKCIQEIEDLLSTHPRGLRYEAVKLMQKAYEQLFKEQLKADEYTLILNRYETEHNRIDRMGSRQLELSIGLAYLEAGLYEESFNHLIDAYKQYKRSARSPELLFGLGLAMDESGRDEDALKLFAGFAKRFTKNKNRVEALTRSGDIYLEQKKYDLASKKYKDAYRAARKRIEKGNILSSHATVFEEKEDFATAADLRERAAKEIALASGENYETLAFAYKELGRTYIELKQYVKSADAFEKALNLSKNERERANLGFLLGDAYQKGNIISKARDAYTQVVESYDSVWARLAQQRLSALELAESAQNS